MGTLYFVAVHTIWYFNHIIFNFLRRVTDITSFEQHFESYSGHTLAFYLNLVKYRFKNIFGRNLSPGLLRWSSLQTKEGQMRSEHRLAGSEIVKRLRCRKYDPVIIERTVCLVLDPSTALYRSLLKRCTLTNKAVGTIWLALSKPLQRWQGPDPRPLWLLVGTPSAFGPELAYRLRIEQPTLMDVPRYFLIYFITIHVCEPHFYDLSALVGCWFSVSIRRIIYKFLNPDYEV